MRHAIQDDLLVAVGAGDERAFALTYERLAGTILGAARRILRDNAHAEEATRDIFVELWRTASGYSPDQGGAFEWVMAGAHRHLVDRLRSRGAAAAPKGRPVAGTVEASDTGQGPLGGLEILPPLQRESVELAYYQGLTYTEIAAAHRISAGTAKTLLREALISLRDRRLSPVHRDS